MWTGIRHRVCLRIFFFTSLGQRVSCSSISVKIGIGCAGFEGIGVVWIFLSGYLWVARERLRFPAALLLHLLFNRGKVWEILQFIVTHIDHAESPLLHTRRNKK